jgi:hypothetical protein
VGRSNSKREGVYVSDFNVRSPSLFSIPACHASSSKSSNVHAFAVLSSSESFCLHQLGDWIDGTFIHSLNASVILSALHGSAFSSPTAQMSAAVCGGGTQTADKAVVEVFPEPASSREVVAEVVRRAVSPASEIGGDARLIMPDERRIKAESAQIGSTVRTCRLLPCLLTIPARPHASRLLTLPEHGDTALTEQGHDQGHLLGTLPWP